MQPDHILAAYEHILINVGFVISLLFAPVNSLWWPWWQEHWGWNIVTLEMCIAGDLLSSFLFIDFHVASDALQWVTAFSLTLTVIIIVWRSLMIWQTQREALMAARQPRERELDGDCPGG